MVAHSLESDIAYFRELVGAGLDGIASSRRERKDRVFTPPLHQVFWTPAAIGAAVGAVSTHLFGKRKSASNVAMGGLVGIAIGCGAAAAWASRGFIVPAAQGAAQFVNAARDAHWLETNPIDYA